MTLREPLQQPIYQPRGKEAPEKHRQEPQMADAVGHAPEGHIPRKVLRIEAIEQEIDDAEDKAGNDETLELLPRKSGEALALAQLHALETEDIAANESYRLNTEAADKMAQPPIKAVFGHTLGRNPSSGEDAQRVIDH